MPSLFLVHGSFSNPGYKATAGAHVFCRLDQEGCLAEEVVKVSKARPADDSDVGKVECLIFHYRSDASDDYRETWFTKRAAYWKRSMSDDRLITYTLWRDVTPKDTDYFFRDTQFSRGSWHQYKAVEAFHFADHAAATDFLEQYNSELAGAESERRQAVFGVPDIIV
jgi:hypothetical protein